MPHPPAPDALFEALYLQLKRLAAGQAQQFGDNVTLSPTAIVHEAYLQLARGQAVPFRDQAHFLAYASRAMRGILIDYARARRAAKRGGAFRFTSLSELDQAPDGAEPPVDLEAIGHAVESLGQLDPRLAELVDLHFFCGFGFAEIAAQRGVSERTVLRDWRKARLLLGHELAEGGTLPQP